MWIQVDSWLGNATTIGYYSCQFAAMGCKIGWFKLWSRKGLLPNLFKLKDLSCKTFLCKTMRERGVFLSLMYENMYLNLSLTEVAYC